MRQGMEQRRSRSGMAVVEVLDPKGHEVTTRMEEWSGSGTAEHPPGRPKF